MNKMKKLRIGQIASLYYPIPAKEYGGVEKVIYNLCDGLTKKGHEVILFASGDSKTSARLYSVVDKGLWSLKKQQIEFISYYTYEMAVVARAAKKLKIDILHDHVGPYSLSLYGQTDIPIIHTIHTPIKKEERIWAYKKLNSKIVSLSDNQRKDAPRLNYVETVYNGIDVENYPFNPNPKDYFLWVGELSPRKGILEVIKIAKLAKIKLILAGKIPPAGRQSNDYLFFKKYIAKELNKGNIIYAGEKTKDGLKNLYKNAIAFLFPLQWEEPFGLVMVEAMACGTPVIAFRRGAVPEIVENGKTGFIVRPTDKSGAINIEGFIGVIDKIGKIDRRACRSAAEERFSIEKMIDGYEKVYSRALNNK